MKLKDMEDADWDKMLKVHLYGTFHCSREALKVMEAKSYGKIVSISSIAATVGLEGAPHYSAAKPAFSVSPAHSPARSVHAASP